MTGLFKRFSSSRQKENSPLEGIYKENQWLNDESVSGLGSTQARTIVIRQNLPDILDSLKVKSLFDAACGDFNWMRKLNLKGMKYTGVDIVPELIARNNELYSSKNVRFISGDITVAPLPRCDAILCRDCFIHLSFAQIRQTLDNFIKTGPKYLLITHYPDLKEHHDIEAGEFRWVNLNLRPFYLPEPLETLVENPDYGKVLSLWETKSLKKAFKDI